MVNIDSEVYTALISDSQIATEVGGRVYYSPLQIPINPKYPLVFYEWKQRPAAWADNIIIAYEATVTIHVMSVGDTNSIMNHVERIMTGSGYIFTNSGPSGEPDCYRDYMVFTKTEEV